MSRIDKTKGLFEGMGGLTAKDGKESSVDFTGLMEEKSSDNLVLKGLHLREDQIADLNEFAKRTNKSQSEFAREVFDIVFRELKDKYL